MSTHTFPTGDNDFEEVRIESVRAEEGSGGWSIEREDGWSFWVPKNAPIAPQPGMLARFYGNGIGYTVRGLFLDGREVFYRTEDAQRQHERDERYGKDARDMIRKWDAGDTIWSITMGGFGPGYEQALQVAAVEFAREGVDVPLEGPQSEHAAIWREVCDHAMQRIRAWGGGLSGAQFGAASWLAWQWLHGAGPAGLIEKHATDKRGDDRTIQVSKRFAHAEPVTAAAPDLLAALTEAEDYLRNCAGSPEIADRCRSAIASATGGQQHPEKS